VGKEGKQAKIGGKLEPDVDSRFGGIVKSANTMGQEHCNGRMGCFG